MPKFMGNGEAFSPLRKMQSIPKDQLRSLASELPGKRDILSNDLANSEFLGESVEISWRMRDIH